MSEQRDPYEYRPPDDVEPGWVIAELQQARETIRRLESDLAWERTRREELEAYVSDLVPELVEIVQYVVDKHEWCSRVQGCDEPPEECPHCGKPTTEPDEPWCDGCIAERRAVALLGRIRRQAETPEED